MLLEFYERVKMEIKRLDFNTKNPNRVLNPVRVGKFNQKTQFNVKFNFLQSKPVLSRNGAYLLY